MGKTPRGKWNTTMEHDNHKKRQKNLAQRGCVIKCFAGQGMHSGGLSEPERKDFFLLDGKKYQKLVSRLNTF